MPAMAESLLRTRRPPLAAEEDDVEIEIGGKRVRIRLRRSARARRITLSVPAATGVPLLTVPRTASTRRALEFAARQGAFLDRAFRRLGDRVPIAEGAVVPVRGVPHVLRHGGLRGHVRIEPADDMPALVIPGERPALPRRTVAWLKAQARADLTKAVETHCAASGLEARRVTLRDPRTRWGSCSSRGGLSFSWRLIMAPPHVLHYLAAHEVAHLQEMNHGAGFWRLVKRLDPGTDAAEAWLKAHGHTLHRYVTEDRGAQADD